MARVFWRRSVGLVKPKSHGFCWGREVELFVGQVIAVLRYIRYRGWRVVRVHEWSVERPVIWAYSPRENSVKPRTIVSGDEEGSRAVHLAAVETLLLGTFPRIIAHLATTRFDDGSPRTPGTVLVKTMGASWVVVLKEPDACLQLQVIAQTLDEALELVEVLLVGEKAPWEPDPWAKARSAKGKKNP